MFHDEILGASDGTDIIFKTNRLGGSFEYAFGGLAAGQNYTVSLHFCELYFSSPGQRSFSVSANHAQTLLASMDVFSAAGMLSSRSLVASHLLTFRRAGCGSM